MTVQYLDLTDYLAIAAAVTGLDVTTILQVTNPERADSALQAPAAGFGDSDFHPTSSPRLPYSWCAWPRAIR